MVGKPEGRRSLGRPRRRWEDNIKSVLGNRICWCELDSCGLGLGSWRAFVNTVMNLLVT
jgi:hypothetical protein